MKNNTVKILASSFALAALTACGGGGDDTPSTEAPPVTVSRAEGIYLESTTRNQKINFLVVNDEFWGLSGTATDSGGMTSVDGLLLGKGTSTNGTYSSNLQYFTNTISSGTVTGSYVAEGRFNGSLSVRGVSQALNAAAPSAANYNYKTPALLNEIVGAWTMNSSFNLVINSAGLISGTDAGCSNTGFITPDTTSGKNVFLVTLKAGNTSACGVHAGISTVGPAVTYLLPNGKRQLLIMGIANATIARGLAGVR